MPLLAIMDKVRKGMRDMLFNYHCEKHMAVDEKYKPFNAVPKTYFDIQNKVIIYFHTYTIKSNHLTYI